MPESVRIHGDGPTEAEAWAAAGRSATDYFGVPDAELTREVLSVGTNRALSGAIGTWVVEARYWRP